MAVEIGILLYQGCQSAMVHGMTDMLMTASGFSPARGGAGLRVSHWSPDETGAFRRSSDTHPAGAGLPDFGNTVSPGTPPMSVESAPFVVSA